MNADGSITPRRLWLVSATYLALALITTWPLSRVLASEIAGDLGDPLFNAWVLLWTNGRVLHLLHGNVAAFANYWNANIFYPAPLTLAYSEHLTPQMLQGLPIFAATNNIVLTYNLLMIAAIVLTGVFTYLLVLDLTGRPLAAFVAGIAFAFAPYRLAQWSHLDVLSSEWMPLTLYGFRRFFVTGRLRPLIVGTASLVLQALSCAYYMAYFTPFAVAYCLYELVAQRRLRDRRTWLALIGAGAAALVFIAVFHLPYARARQLTDVGLRDLKTVQGFSADTWAFATVADRSWLWGERLQALDRPQGQGFPGFTILALAVVAIGAAVARNMAEARSIRGPAAAGQRTERWRSPLAWIAGAACIIVAALFVYALATGRGVVSIGELRLRFRPARLPLLLAGSAAALVMLSPWCRRVARGRDGSPLAFFAWATIAAAALALGPTMYANRRPIGPGLYSLYLRYVPGFDGLRVPALHFMIMALMLAVLAGLGSAFLLSRRRGRFVVLAAALAILVESWSVPVETHAPPQIATHGVRADVIPVYRFVRDLPAGAVIAEFPFGEVWEEIGYTFAAGYHEKPILNGYSGFFPGEYERLKVAFDRPAGHPQAWPALLASGATHAVVHQDHPDGRAVSDWLIAAGAREVAAFGPDRVYALR